MIARLRILLPYRLHLFADVELSPFEFEKEGLRVRIYPPYKSKADQSVIQPDLPWTTMTEEWLEQLGNNLLPADPQPRQPYFFALGRDMILPDALQIDLFRESFDRRQGAEDPPLDLCFRFANGLLSRLRTFNRCPYVKAVSLTSTMWQIKFLADDEQEPPREKGLQRGRTSTPMRWSFAHVSKAIWDGVEALPPEFESSPWDRLLLDAQSLLPDIGPALVLTHAAVETRIESALKVLAPKEDPGAGLWAWIEDRDSYWKAPSVADQLNPLLFALSGHSLVEDEKLWAAFNDLKKARNTFAHQGHALIGKNPVTLERTNELIDLAGEIIDWIEALLPAEERRPRYPGQGEGFNVSFHIDTRPPAESSP